jgi:enamine deaminase RidA (YjgF/YER057c/UK114 family)
MAPGFATVEQHLWSFIMSTIRRHPESETLMTKPLSEGEKMEMERLGLLDERGDPVRFPVTRGIDRTVVRKQAISNPNVLNEAYDYGSAFTRGLRVELKAGASFLWISGTASVDENGDTIHVGDFRAQCWRTWRNITELLESQGATWHDIVRTTCYLRDIERDYRDFNEIRTHFFNALKLDPLPASTGIQARICREDLLVEIEAIAILEREIAGE